MIDFIDDRIRPFAETLDKIAFEVGNHRVSAWSALITLLVLLLVVVVARLGSRLAGRLLARVGALDPAQRLLGEKLLSIAIWLVAFFVGIDVLGIDLTALAVFSGAFGLAIGFGLQKTFGNLIAGIILLMDRSIKPGDVIAVNDGTNSVIGQVKKIGIRAVSVTTRDKKEFLIPNENLMVNQVENWSFSSRDVRITVPVGVSYSADLELAERLMLEAARGSPRVLDLPPPTVWLTAFAENAIAFEIQLWINDPEEGLGNVRSDVLKRLWKLFHDNGVEVPFPQRDINLRKLPREWIEAIRAARGEGPPALP